MMATVFSWRSDHSFISAPPPESAKQAHTKQIDVRIRDQPYELHVPQYVPDEIHRLIADILTEYHGAISVTDTDIGLSLVIQHEIQTGNHSPIHCKPYRYSLVERKKALERIREFEESGWIEPATGPWSFSVVLVPKKNGSIRICIDYRKLNDITIKDVYPLPRIDDLLDAIGCANYFSKFDIRHGFHHILVKEEDRSKTAFVLFEGTWQWVRCPMGICNAPATFQRAMNVTFQNFVNKTRLTQGMINFCVIVYMEDILVYSETYHGHAQHIEWTLGALRDAGFKIALEKSEFFLSEISFLGYLVTRGGLRPDSRKVAAVREAPVPMSLTQVRAFLGLASYYRRFIKGFAAIARPLTNLLRKDQSFQWDAECEQAFVTLKETLATALILIRPDPAKQYILITDWQPEAISAILAQKGNDGREHVIEYASRTVPDERRNDSAPQGECHAVVWGIQHFHPYLYGHKFLLLTDHEPLLPLKKLANYTGMIGRWAWGLWREHFVDLSVCLVRVRITWTRDEEHREWIEYLELLIIQAWMTNVEGDLLGFLSGSVWPGHRQLITQELKVPLAQLADDLPLEIASLSDESLVPHVLSRTLTPYLQWSVCLEEPGSDRNPPSQRDYLNPHEIVYLAFFQDHTTSENEAIEIEEEEEISGEEEEAEEEDDDEETPKEGSYSEHSEGEQSPEEEEEEQEEDEEELKESEYQGFEEEVCAEARAQKREEIADGKRQLEFASAVDRPIVDDPGRNPEPPKPEDRDPAAETSSAPAGRRRNRSPSPSTSARPPVRQRTNAGHRASKFDIRHGFYHILVKEENRPKTAFVLLEDTWQWVRCPMGICNAPATFQRAMNVTFQNFVNKTRLTQGMINFCVIVYMGDILVYSETYHGYAQHIEWTLGAMRDAQDRAGEERVLPFGALVLGLCSDTWRFAARLKKGRSGERRPVPTSLTQVRTFLGLTSYYRRFIKGFAAIARPLTKLLRKDQPLSWDAECEQAFATLKDALATAPILIRPDPAKQFILITDWQPEAISAILAQKGNDGREHVIEYASRTVPDERKNDSAPQGECYAVVWGIQHSHPYFYGHKFRLVTDHEPLLALKKLTNYTGMIGRWAVRLQEYDFDIIHRKTERHGNADGLTRLHRPAKVPKGEEIIPWKEPESANGPKYGKVAVLPRGKKRTNGNG
ncbi:hypothetical protein CBR_g38591 [Chara braunii]|uniref:Reverse transcriptase domain-containing protein n=1 Tax=Chara braunii TaxID=69332 RepID=A0A388K0N7_CHABU|nr:hypothetical protein CBR_g38591 [Chara braunii]|eukprot:GBG63523.1 hypothetical protein CBR_g38591 [Chara braunii]